MDENKLYITISDNRGGDGGTKPTKQQATSEKTPFTTYLEHQLFNVTKQQVLKAVNYGISNIGNFTGDYTTERKVNELKQSISGIMGVALLTKAGASVGGIYGAIAGFVVGVVSVTSDAVYQNHSRSVEMQKTNYSIEQLRQRSGLNVLLDNSRGTEN